MGWGRRGSGDGMENTRENRSNVERRKYRETDFFVCGGENG